MAEEPFEFEVSDEVYELLEKAANIEGVSVDQFVTNAVKAMIERYKAEQG